MFPNFSLLFVGLRECICELKPVQNTEDSTSSRFQTAVWVAYMAVTAFLSFLFSFIFHLFFCLFLAFFNFPLVSSLLSSFLSVYLLLSSHYYFSELTFG